MIGLAGLIIRVVEDQAPDGGQERVDVVISDTVPPVRVSKKTSIASCATSSTMRSGTRRRTSGSPSPSASTPMTSLSECETEDRGSIPTNETGSSTASTRSISPPLGRSAVSGWDLYLPARGGTTRGAYLARPIRAPGSVFAVRLPTAQGAERQTADIVSVVPSA